MGFFNSKINGFFLNTLEKPFKRSLVSTSIVSVMHKTNPQNALNTKRLNPFQKWKTNSKANLLLGILFGSSIFISCELEPTIPQQKMIPLMADVIRLEASQQVEYNYQTLSDSLWTLNYSFVLKKHQIDSNEFKQTLEFYKRNPSDFSNLMGKVIDELQEEEIKRFRR